MQEPPAGQGRAGGSRPAGSRQGAGL